jgi:hypothetical protein
VAVRGAFCTAWVPKAPRGALGQRAHHRLDRLRHHLPRFLVLEFRREPRLIDFELPESALERTQRHDEMAEGRADTANRGAIAQIALPSRNRQLGCEMLEHRDRESEIAFAIFEVDGFTLCGITRNRPRRDGLCVKQLIEM